MKNIKILDKYIFFQVLGATAVCILLFSIIWIAPEILLRTVQRVLNGTYTVEMGISAILCEIPKILGNALPVGVLLGSLFTFDKLSKDSEITVLRACGASFYRIIASALFLGVIIAGLSFVVRDRLIPYASMNYDIMKRYNGGTHFVFPIKDEHNSMQRVIIVPDFRSYKITNVVVLNFAKEENQKGNSILNSIYMSDFVKYNEQTHDWTINNATTYELSREGVYEKVGNEKDITVLTGQRGENAYELMKFSLKRDRDMTNRELKRYIHLLKTEAMDDEYRFMLNKYLERFSQSIIAVLFVILGCLLGFAKPRDHRVIGFTIAVIAIFLYYITMPFLDMLAEKGILHPFITAFLAPVVLYFLNRFLKQQKDL